MDGAGRERQVLRFVDEVWNKRNYDAVGDLYGEDYVTPFGTGPAAKTEAVRRYHDIFADLHVEVQEVVVGTDGTVVVRQTLRGTDVGGYAGRPPTGRTVSEWVVNILRFEGDRVVSEFIGADKLGLFIELGVVDDPWPK
jgi:predicted ester cyclase